LDDTANISTLELEETNEQLKGAKEEANLGS